MAFIRIAMMICAAKGVVVDGRGRFYCRNKPRSPPQKEKGKREKASESQTLVLSPRGQIGTPFSERNIVLQGVRVRE